MSRIPEQMIEINKSAIETALRFAKISMDSAEQLVKLQLEAAKAAMEENAANAKALAETKDLQAAAQLRLRMMENSVSSAVNFSRSVYDVASRAQTDLARLFEERMQLVAKGMTGAMERAASNAPGGSEILKSTIAASTAAMDTMTRAAKQMAELADASMKAAAAATTDAVTRTTSGAEGAKKPGKK